MSEAKPDILPEIPDSESIRQRLAIVSTEASVLRSQLRVSVQVERERERLRRLIGETSAGKAVAHAG